MTILDVATGEVRKGPMSITYLNDLFSLEQFDRAMEEQFYYLLEHPEDERFDKLRELLMMPFRENMTKAVKMKAGK